MDNFDLPKGTFKSLSDPKRHGNIFIKYKRILISNMNILILKITLQFLGEYKNNQIVIMIPNDYDNYLMNKPSKNPKNSNAYDEEVQHFMNGFVSIKKYLNMNKIEKSISFDDHVYIYNDYK
jgi:hypothetical protein